MKKIINTIFLAVILGAGSVTSVAAQQKNTSKDPVYVIVDKKPAFPGGEEALKKYFDNALAEHKFPGSGIVTLSMVINKNGQVQDVVVSNGMSPRVDAAVLKAAQAMPRWQPGQKANENVNARVTQPVQIKMSAEAQEADADQKPYEFVQQMPSFPGGESELIKFLADNTNYPESGIKHNIQGTVFVKFIVTSNGGIKDPVILKDLGPDFGKEVVRMLQSMPKWEPGKANGRPVNVYYTLPVRFQIPKESIENQK